MTQIRNVSDTALWVAYYRAMETERPDAIFRDPFAARLAGDKGREITDSMKRGRATAWAMIVRTAVFDEIILERVRNGNADLVLNLAAGLDTRPWRMKLPPTLRWIDVDLPGMIDYKTDAMSGETPVCQYEAIRLDLTDVAKRQALFNQLARETQRVIVITEGLLIYLKPEQVAELARDLHTAQSFRWWVLDIASPKLLEWMSKSWGKSVEQGNAPFQFAPAEGTQFFESFGWREAEFRSAGEEARRLNRQMRGMWMWRILGMFMSKAKRAEMRRMAGQVLLERV